MQRRAVLVATASVPLAGCGHPEVKTFPTIASAVQAIESVAGGHFNDGRWNLSQLLQHAAQSVEYSIDGYPERMSGLFRATVGAAAFFVFDARGTMAHRLDEPIPGAPPLLAEAPLAASIRRAVDALRRFEAHSGALAPHFAYGALDKAQYTRAHLMHLANHWSEVRRT